MPKQKKKFIPLPYKQLGKDISKYPFVEIKWVDIEGDDGWHIPVHRFIGTATSAVVQRMESRACWNPVYFRNLVLYRR